MILWQSGDLLQMLKEAETIQKGIKESTKLKPIAQLSKKFIEYMSKGNVNSAIKLHLSNMENGVLLLNDNTINLLKKKHPWQSETGKPFSFDDIPQSIHKINYEDIDAEIIRIRLCVQEMGQGLQVWMPMVGEEYSHATVFVRVPPTYVWPWPMLRRSYV